LNERRKSFLAHVLLFVCALALVSAVGIWLINSLKSQPSGIDATTMSLQQQLDKYRATELLQPKKPIEIPKLDPKIINRELEKVGQLIVFKGQMIYNEPVTNKGLLWQRKLEFGLPTITGLGLICLRSQ
jgi:predicted PurR-regulated permease PerM